TKPKCTASMFGSQAHHVHRWEYGGRTTIGNLGAACGHDNRREGPGSAQWKTAVIRTGPDKGRVGWIDPTDPTRTPQVNNTLFPEVILRRIWARHHTAAPAPPPPDGATPTPPQRE
ncbi:HNH endonuclease, partial [Gordonia sp. TBRC 11910]